MRLISEAKFLHDFLALHVHYVRESILRWSNHHWVGHIQVYACDGHSCNLYLEFIFSRLEILSKLEHTHNTIFTSSYEAWVVMGNCAVIYARVFLGKITLKFNYLNQFPCLIYFIEGYIFSQTNCHHICTLIKHFKSLKQYLRLLLMSCSLIHLDLYFLHISVYQ